MWKTCDCYLCGGEQYENQYCVMCFNDNCPSTESYPTKEQLIWGWQHNPAYMRETHKCWVDRWEVMGKDYEKWLLEYFRSRVGVRKCNTKL